MNESVASQGEIEHNAALHKKIEGIMFAPRWKEEIDRLTWESLFGEVPETKAIAEHQKNEMLGILQYVTCKFPGTVNIAEYLKKRVETMYAQLQTNDPVIQMQHPHQKTLDSIAKIAKENANTLSQLLDEEIKDCDDTLSNSEKIEIATVNALQKYMPQALLGVLVLLMSLGKKQLNYVNTEEIVSTYLRNFYEHLVTQSLPEKYLGIMVSRVIETMLGEINKHIKEYEGAAFKNLSNEISETKASHFVALYYPHFFNNLNNKSSFNTDKELIDAAREDLRKLAQMFKNSELEYNDFVKILHKTVVFTLNIVANNEQLNLMLRKVLSLLENQISVLKRTGGGIQEMMSTYIMSPYLAEKDANGLHVISDLLMEVQLWADLMRKYKLESLATFIEYAISVLSIQFVETTDAVLSGKIARNLELRTILTDNYYLGLNEEELQIFKEKPYLILVFVSKFIKLFDKELMSNNVKTRNSVRFGITKAVNTILKEYVKPARENGVPQNWLIRFVSEA